MNTHKRLERMDEVARFISDNPNLTAEAVQGMLIEACRKDCSACRWLNFCAAAGSF